LDTPGLSDQLRSTTIGQHTITFACGHTESRIIGGKLREQESKVGWLEGQTCWQCQRAAENAAVAAVSATRGWPALEGSEKQVAWASTIRAEMLERLLLPVLAGALLEQAEARWWIDHRAESPEILAWRAVGEPAEPTRAVFVATLLEGPGLRHDGGGEALAGAHEGLRDGILTFVFDHADYAALAERLGVSAGREGE